MRVSLDTRTLHGGTNPNFRTHVCEIKYQAEGAADSTTIVHAVVNSTDAGLPTLARAVELAIGTLEDIARRARAMAVDAGYLKKLLPMPQPVCCNDCANRAVGMSISRGVPLCLLHIDPRFGDD